MEPLRPLGPNGSETWKRITRMDAAWIEQAVDRELLQVLCELVDERDGLRRLVLAEGEWRDRTALRALDQQLLQCFSMLGLTPTDRAKTGLQARDGNDDELATFIQSLSSPVRDAENAVAPDVGPAGSESR